MQRSSAVFLLFSFAIIYLAWVYVNALFDPAIELHSNNFTISAVADDSERQLIVLIIVLLMSFVTSTMLYESGKNNVSNVVPVIGLLFLIFLYSTILVRITYAPLVHYLFAGSTFLFMLLLCVAMAPHTSLPIVSYVLSAVSFITFFPVAINLTSHQSSVWIATAEFVSIVAVTVITFLFFSKD
jgi:hypothetical protein